MRPRRSTFAAVVLALAVIITGCVPEGDRSASPSPSASSATASQTPTPTTASPTPAATAEPSPGESSADGEPSCWTIAVPDIVITTSQTPEQFAAENPGLIESGAPSPCSIFADGSLVAQGDQWLDGLVANGWTDRGRVEDDVYTSRSAVSADRLVATYLAPVEGSTAAPVTQFQTYPG